MHPINRALDRNEKKKPCDNGYPYYRFDHLDCACVLSSVYSVNKGQPCTVYVEKLKESNTMRSKVGER